MGNCGSCFWWWQGGRIPRPPDWLLWLCFSNGWHVLSPGGRIHPESLLLLCLGFDILRPWRKGPQGLGGHLDWRSFVGLRFSLVVAVGACGPGGSWAGAAGGAATGDFDLQTQSVGHVERATGPNWGPQPCCGPLFCLGCWQSQWACHGRCKQRQANVGQINHRGQWAGPSSTKGV